MNEREIMRTTKHFITMLFCLLPCAPLALARQAQDKQSETQSANPISQDVMIIIQQEKVRFTAQKAVQEMRLQILDQSGAVVYDSGSVAEPALNWPLQDASGVQVKSGLYAYTLTIQEEGSGATRVRRGHFIVDRAKDRDGQNDRLWITSQNDAGIGSDLTVARSENDTVAGVSVANEQTPVQESGSKLTTSGLAAGTEAKSDTNALTPAMAAGANGTAGYLAKFTTATDLGNSSVVDQNGNIGIGTFAPSYKLHLAGHTTYDWPIIKLQNLDSGGHSYWLYGGAKGIPGNFGIYDETAQAYRFYLNGNGNVGIGTTALSSSRLTLDGQDALTAQGYEPFLTLYDSNSSGSHRIQSAHGDLNFFQSTVSLVGGIPTTTYTPRMVIKDGGNVGIGTATPEPAAKLHVAGSFLRVDGAANEQAYIGGDGIGNDVNLGSSNPSVTDVVLWNRSTSTYMNLVIRALTINGGSDFSENFDVNEAPDSGEAAPTKVEAGLVVSIDPASPGKLQPSTQAYDRRVAGVISGAGGVKPGMMMSQPGTLADGQFPVALSGRVYCWVDATQGAIEPGDLLTTSNTPGHAMKATDAAKAQGAIIGKAMTGLKEGKGLALVLVTLQ
jgi:hypothetical protein